MFSRHQERLSCSEFTGNDGISDIRFGVAGNLFTFKPINEMKNEIFKKNLSEAQAVLEQFMSDERNYECLESAGMIMVNALSMGKKIISCGNGGSMSDAMHFAEELSGRFRDDRKGIAAIAISDPSHLTCTANDYGFNEVFARFVQAVGAPGDVLLAISTSGNSHNVVKAAQEAHSKGMKVVALTGRDGGELGHIADECINVEHNGYSDRIQEMHIKIIHSLIHFIETNLDLSSN